ncbi:unnamed protein product [Prorocentrum cordatum]|uniref:Protein kinase domain-containing protein n=1 Tax=Prorocentrum cordatum TaxID=2364126 RepID=A0ABN9WM74_9DINO|nr:unnamed protein product [Polarella glacialis]
MLKNMDHHRIIKYLDSFIEDSELVIVLELAPHGDLAGLCRLRKQEGGALAEEQVLAIFLQVCDALCYMHRNRMMHRDIKPANIFICGHGNVKLGDLGLGRYFSDGPGRLDRYPMIVDTSRDGQTEVTVQATGGPLGPRLWLPDYTSPLSGAVTACCAASHPAELAQREQEGPAASGAGERTLAQKIAYLLSAVRAGSGEERADTPRASPERARAARDPCVPGGV